ncbi:MAG: alpha/beta fold hydrolase [Gemmobacter sp.]
MPTSQLLKVGDVAFPFVSAGTGEAVLFVNGSWADLRGWCDLWPDVAVGHRFMAYTHRHFGTTLWPQDKPFSRDVHTDDLVAILRTLNVPTHLVGWSYSGAMVLRAATEVPDLISSVAIYEPSLSSILPDTLNNRALLQAFGQGFAKAYAAAKAGDGAGAMPMAVEFVLGMEKGGFATLDPRIQAMLLENAHTMIPDFDAPSPQPLTCEQLGEVRCPVLLIVGAETLPHYKLVAAEVLACLQDASLSEIQGVGHGGPWQARSEFVRRVLDFVDLNACGSRAS